MLSPWEKPANTRTEKDAGETSSIPKGLCKEKSISFIPATVQVSAQVRKQKGLRSVPDQRYSKGRNTCAYSFSDINLGNYLPSTVS